MRAKSPSTLLLIGSALLCLLGRPAPARAVPEFPMDIANYFKEVHKPPVLLGYPVPCSLCHIDGTTGPGSVQTPFGISMLAHGLTEDPSALETALSSLETEHVDSDGDGDPDIDELIQDKDPNTPADVPLSTSAPSYGCAVASVHVQGRRTRPGPEALGLGAVVLVVLRRRSRAS
jgi:hypothetical protein